jgi:hypothetical protein
MARQASLNIQDYLDDKVMDNLAETLDGVIENIQTSAVSEALKNKEGSGDPISGSTEYKRFANAELKDKGTARTARAGAQVIAKPVIVNIDDNKEIIEELQLKDLKLYGIDGMAEKRKGNFTKRVIAYLDRKFFATTVTAGTKFDRGTLTAEKDILDAMIVSAKSTQSDFIDGIDAEDLAIVLSPAWRKAVKNDLDELPNGTATSNGAIGMYDSIIVHETHRLPEGVNAIVMLKGSVAQPYYLSEYGAEKVPFDDAVALETFLYNGSKALVDEAILYDADEVTPSV